MTIVAWDGRTLAADKRTTFSGMSRTAKKIMRGADGSLLGAAGNTARCRELMEWVTAGAKPEAWKESWSETHAIHVRTDGSFVMFDGGPTPIEFEDRFHAIGCGRDFAMAAMYLGKTAREAVEVACHFDVHCGNGIDTLELGA